MADEVKPKKSSKTPVAITPQEARLQLWETGELSWKLEPSQKEILSFIKGNAAKTIVVNSSRRLGKCLTEGTEVLTPFGPKPIEKLQIGDTVYGLDSDGQVRPTTVLNVWCNGEREVVDLVNHSKVMASCSEDHVWATTTLEKGSQFFQNTAVKDFSAKTRLIQYPSLDLEPLLVEVTTSNKRRAITWDITVGNDTNLYLLANGLVTHNSFASCAYAIELCIKNPRSTVKYLAGQQRMVRDIVAEIMPYLLEDCPAHLKPEYKVNQSSWIFPNGSRIQMAGVDNKRHNNLRGGSSVACIVDEAAFVDELKYTVQSVLLPTTTTTNGKIILISTPPESPDHDFVTYIEEAQFKGAYLKKTIYDYFVDMKKAGKEPKRITEDAINGFIEEYGGAQSTTFKREYLCEIVTETDFAIFPEATDEQMSKMIVKDYPKPPYYDPYVAMDIGFKDLTVALFAYYDFRNDKIVIEDELVMSGPSMTTEILANAIRFKEEQLWRDPLTKEIRKVYKRISDNNLIVINDMQKDHRLNFLPTAKDDRLAAINAVRMNIAAKRYIIHERCETLIRHMKNGKWNKAKNDFARSPENGHYDGCSAIMYLTRNIEFSRNPYPKFWDMDRGDDTFYSLKSNKELDTPVKKWADSLGNWRKKK